MSVLSESLDLKFRSVVPPLGSVWGVDTSAVAEVRDVLRDGSGGQPLMEQLRDPGWLPQLVTYRPVKHAGAAYVVPGLIAWTLLAVAEFLFSWSGAGETSFFGWWSQQLLSPGVYSLGVAIALVVVVRVEHLASKKSARQRDMAHRVETLASELAVWATSTVGTRDSLALASNRLTAAASALQQISGNAEQVGAVLRDTRQTTAQANQAASALGAAAGGLAAPARDLTDAVLRLEPFLTHWPDTSRSITSSLGQLESARTAMGAQLEQLSGVADSLLQTAAQSTRGVTDLVEVTKRNASAQPGVDETVRRLSETTAALQQAQSELARLLRETTLLMAVVDGDGVRRVS